MTQIATTIYIVDTSSFINLQEWRPISSKNDAVWRKIDGLVRDDRLESPVEVFEEIKREADRLARWAMRYKKVGQLFKRPKDYAKIAKQIIGRFPDLVDIDRPSVQADPFVIALAEFESRQTLGQRCMVVTEESFRPGRSKIPHVCAALGLQYMTIHQMFVTEGTAL